MSQTTTDNATADTNFATHTEAAARLLSDAILSGGIAPGSRLNIRSISQDTGIGPTPIREALANLAGRGLVTFAGQRGFRVAPVSREHLSDIMTARTVIESGALSLAITHGTDEWEVEIVASLHRLKIFTDNPPADLESRITTFERVHRNFHIALISACGSERLVEIFLDLYEQTRRYRALMLKSDVDGYNAYQKHARIAQHCIQRDRDRALMDLASHNAMLVEAIYGPLSLS